MKPKELTEVLKKFCEKRKPILLTGSPGIGKTEIVQAAANALGYELILSHPVVGDPTDYKGYPFFNPETNEASFVPFKELNRLITTKKPIIFFLDDLGQAPLTVQAAAMQLILGRQVNGHQVSNDVIFIAATNRREDKAGVQRLIEPLKSRFTSIIELDTDQDQWVRWAIDNEIDERVISFIRWKPDLLNDFEPTNDLRNTPSPRTNFNVSEILKMQLPFDITDELVSGAIGDGYRLEFMAFLKIWTELPNVKSIFLNPDTAEVPEDQPSVMYALTGAVAAQASKTNMESICTYSERIPPEFSVKMIMQCIEHDSDVQQTKAFIRWSEAHHEFLV